MPALNLKSISQNFLRQGFIQLTRSFQSLLTRPAPSHMYGEEVALLMQSYQAQQSNLDKIASWWSEHLWWYEKSLIAIGTFSATIIISSFTAALLVGTLFLGLAKLLTNHHKNNTARKERICTDIINTQKKLTESLALIKKHEVIFKETIARFEQQTDLLTKDNAAIHQQSKNLEIENQRLHYLITITEKSVVLLREQQENLVNRTQTLTTEVQNFLVTGVKETTQLHHLLRTLIQEFSKNVTTLISIKDKLLNTMEFWQQPNSLEPHTEIDCDAIIKESQMLCVKVQKIRDEEEKIPPDFKHTYVIKRP